MIKWIFLFFFVFGQSVLAQNKLLDISFEENKTGHARIFLKLDKSIEKDLRIETKQNIIQLEIPGGIVWPKIEKRIEFKNKKWATIMAYQYNKEIARVRILLPFKTSDIKKQIQLKKLEKSIVLDFPVSTLVSVTEKKLLKYDESYLNKLLRDKKENSLLNNERQFKDYLKKDLVSLKESATQKKKIFNEQEKGPSIFSSYIGKFFIFFLVVMGFFIMVIMFFKKSVVKKGKLGFLKGNDIVQVLSTTYVGPKKNLLLVKVQNKVLLLGSSETGLNFLSEIESVPSVMKSAEEEILGDNFDIRLEKSNNEERNFRLKENINESVNSSEKKKEDKSMTEQIKKKLKGLKSLQ